MQRIQIIRMTTLSAELADFDSDSPEATLEYGRRLAAELPRPALILLLGELGAGKTMLVKGLAEGCDAARAEEVSSPTYTLIHEYGNDTLDFHHLDLYRLESARDLRSLGLEDLLRPRNKPAIIAVEWGEKLRELDDTGLAGLNYLEVDIRRAGEERRKIRARWRDGQGTGID